MAYQDLLSQIRSLPLEEQQKLLEELQVIVRDAMEHQPMHHITELEGLGAEIWKDVDVEAYINNERDSWE